MDRNMLRVHRRLTALVVALLVGPVLAGPESVPDAVLEESGFSATCVLSAIDEDPDSTDGTWCAATDDNTNTSLRTSFATPGSPTTDGADLQEYRCLFKPNAGCGTDCGDAFIALWEASVLVSTSAVTTVGLDGSCTQTGEFVKSYTWDSTGRTDADIEARCYVTKSGGAPTARCSGDIGAVEWNATLTSAGRSRRTIP